MNESEVEVIFGHDCNVSTAYTTHADYMALEEEVIELRVSVGQDTDTITRLEEELASIKARMGELVAAAENTLAVEKRYGLGGSASDRLSSALEAFK